MNQNNSGGKNGKSDRQSIATIAESALARGVTGGESTATTPAKQQHIGQGDRVSVTRASTERDNGVVTATVKTCEICGRQYVTARPTVSKYCGPSCKRRGWLAADPERAARVAASDRARLRAHFEARGGQWEERQAGGGRAGVALVLAVAVLVLVAGWYFSPTILASRAAMATNAANAVIYRPQVQPVQPAAASVQPMPVQVDQVQPMPTAVQPVQPMPVQPVQPVQVQPVQPTAVQPVQVDQVQPMPTDQVLTAAGWVDRVTAEFWADCAHGQAAGRRVSPRCPANAGEMLGGGR